MTEMTTEQAIRLAQSIPDIAGIESARDERDKLREKYDATSDLNIKSDLGREINRLNDEINVSRGELAKNAIDYASAAQILETDISMMRGEIDSIGYKGDEISRAIMEFEHGIEEYTGMVDNLLPDEFDTPGELAEFAKKPSDDEHEKWYNPDGSIRDIYLDEMKYGRKGIDSASVIEDDGKILKDGTAVKHCNICEIDIANAGKKPILTSGELKNISMLNSSEKIIEAVEERCAANRIRAYESALEKMGGDMVGNALVMKDVDGEEVEISKGVTCKISHKEIKDAFEHKMKIEIGIPGSGRKHITKFLKGIFGDVFSDADYVRMSDYDDVCGLVDDINETCLEHGIYDIGLIEYGVDQIDENALIHVGDVTDELDNVFGDQFTKAEYETVAKSIVDTEGIIDDNKENLMSQFRGSGTDRQIRAGKILKGIENRDYNEKWEKDRQRMIKGGIKDVETELKKKQLENAREIFNRAIEKIDEDTFMYRDDVNRELVEMGLQENLVRKLMIGINDLDHVRNGNRIGVYAAMKRLIIKRGMLKDDVFSERRLEYAVRERELNEMGDPKKARYYMQSAISDVVGKVDMGGYEESLSDMCCEKVSTEFDTIDHIVDDFISRKKSFIDMTSEKINTIAENTTKSLYAGESEEENVNIPDEEERKEKEEEEKEKKKEELEEKKKMKEERKTRHLSPFPEHEMEAARIALLGEYRPEVITKQEIKLREREEKFFDIGFILKKMIGKSEHRVYGKGNEYVTFGDVKTLDKWLKDQNL